MPSGFLLAQGSLTPPGAPAPTMKTLDQVEPRIDVATLPGDAVNEHVINLPGSYYLSNAVTTAKSVGIIVAAPASGVISGATGGAGVGSTDPWANFSY